VGLRLVVGLGNPGERYERTRHNVGFSLADRLAGGESWKSFANDLGLWAKVGSFYVAKPMTYMNDSGLFVQQFAAFYKVKPEEMLIVFDDIALPLGTLRVRGKGSSGGQKGMESIIRSLGTDAVPRLRVGIGPQPEFMDSAAFVLQKFSRQEEKPLDEALERAGAAVHDFEALGLEACMNRYNPKA
jgi:peptidyl-tRNA hydrolase, PTH1 family